MSWTQFGLAVSAVSAFVGIVILIVRIGMAIGRVESTLQDMTADLVEIKEDYRQLSRRVSAVERRR